jgi:hypothetical protein
MYNCKRFHKTKLNLLKIALILLKVQYIDSGSFWRIRGNVS